MPEIWFLQLEWQENLDGAINGINPRAIRARWTSYKYLVLLNEIFVDLRGHKIILLFLNQIYNLTLQFL